jgi:hypothetical protein
MDRSGAPVWFLATRVVPYFELSDFSEPTEGEMTQRWKFVRRLEKAVRRYQRDDDIQGARQCFRNVRRVLLRLKKHRLRAAYNNEIWRVEIQFENQWRWYQAQKKREERWEERWRERWL